MLAHGAHLVTLPGTEDQVLPVESYPASQPSTAQYRKRNASPLRNAVIAEAYTVEEKGMDVNLAVHLLNDAWMNRYDVAAVVSNDTDLVEPIRMVSVERGKVVIVVCPGRRPIAPKLKSVANRTRHIRKKMLSVAQFPNCIPDTSITRPESW